MLGARFRYDRAVQNDLKVAFEDMGFGGGGGVGGGGELTLMKAFLADVGGVLAVDFHGLSDDFSHRRPIFCWAVFEVLLEVMKGAAKGGL